VNINFQHVYDDEVEDVTKELMKLPRRYAELPPEVQRLVEDLVLGGYQRALADALDPVVLEETSALSKEMSNQLSSMSDLIESFLSHQNTEGGN
tara:strand:+ start:166 stop:447 length:282 start_codon:yes stop_codon:yes gene_type:complete